jgi:uncharacterized membrane protein
METAGARYEKESHVRSILKGISWRIIGTLDTMLLSYLITGHIQQALKIGFTEVFTKIVLYWLHERIWQYFLVGKQQSRLISIVKAVSWRLLGSLDTLLISWYYTGNFRFGMTIASLELLTKMILYYFHERAWLHVPKGTIRKVFKK